MSRVCETCILNVVVSNRIERSIERFFFFYQRVVRNNETRQLSRTEQREEDAGPDQETPDQKQHQPRTEPVPTDHNHPR